MDLEKIEQDVKSRLSEKRFKHSQGVKKRAVELAKIYGLNEEIAAKVGIAHDVAKEIPNDEKLKYIEENNIKTDEIEILNPGLLHGKIGADIAKKIYGFSEEMQDAIKYHTTGNPKMDLLAKIIFAADKTEENRKSEKFDIEKERELSNKDIDEAMIFMLEENIKLNLERKNLIHVDTINTRNYIMIHKF